MHFACRVFLITKSEQTRDGDEMVRAPRADTTVCRGVGFGDEFPPPLDPPVRRRIFNLPEDARGSVELKAQQPGDTLSDQDREHNSAFLTPAVGDHLHHNRRFLL